MQLISSVAGITNTPLTQLPHSSTLSDLFGERRAAGGLRGEAASSANGEGGGRQARASTLSSSASENRIVGEG